MASNKMLGSYDQKTTPEDNDLLVEYDAAASKVKNVKFGNVWNWIVKKLTSAVISELTTSNQNIVGAINELNSKTYINIKNLTEYSYIISFDINIYSVLLMYGASPSPFMYVVFIDTLANKRKVSFYKVIEGTPSRTFSGTYDDATTTLNITCSTIIWGGIRIIAIK